jgi:hypothetical protein
MSSSNNLDGAMVALCPNCLSDFNVSRHGGVYGLHPTGFDDVFFVVLCQRCHVITETITGDPRRERLKARVKKFFESPTDDCFCGRVAVTTLKILELHSGDLLQALEFGWPLPKAMHHYDLATLPGGVVLISEKEVKQNDL